ncbi:Fn3-like domain-containing protein, partial [Thomasclavelia sp.]
MKKTLVKKFLVSIVAVTMVFSMSFTTGVALDSKNTITEGANLLDELTEGNKISNNQHEPDEIVTVVVELERETTLDVDEYVTMFQKDSIGYSADASVAAYRADMVSQQEEIQTQISAFAPNTMYKYHYTNLLNGFAAQVEYQYIEKIEALDGVMSVYMTQSYDYNDDWEEDEENTEYISLEEYYKLTGCDAIDTSRSVMSDAGSTSQMGLEAAWEAGYTGAGKVVGVFDSSIRYTHQLFSYMDPQVEKDGEAGLLSNYKTKDNLLGAIKANQNTLNLFQSGWGSWFHQNDETGFSKDVQENILNGDFYYNSKVPFSVDYACGDLDAWDGDSSSHGTHVSGIVAGNGGEGYYETSGVKGSAYDSQIMFFKVFDENDDFGQESDEAVFAALDDAITLGVNAFNLSLGIPNGFTTMNTYAQAGYQRAYNRASASGISICVSAGNDARDSHPGALVNGFTTLLPNSASGGFSGTLYAPMTIASAQGTGYSYINNWTDTTAVAVNANGDAVNSIVIADIYDAALGETLTGTYELVDCGDGSSITQDLTNKVALVKRTYGYVPYDEEGIMAAQQNAYKAGAVAVYMTFDYYGDYFDSDGLWTGENGESIPVFGGTATNSAVYSTLSAAIAAGTVNVSFSSEKKSQSVNRSYNDNGPAGSTSWGVTEAMSLKPDVMSPGGNIWSAGAASDTALTSKSGTSMASPNAEGLFILAQQYVDANLNVFGVRTGTQEYSNLVNQLVASTARAYQPFVSSQNLTRQNLYFSPRRQGAGMVNIDNVINSKVVLHNDASYNNLTGESARTKVELGDKLGTNFDIKFTMDNYDSVAKTFDVLACLQTDNTTEANGRTNLAAVNTYGSDIDAIEDGVMKVTSVSGGTIVSASDNVNRYGDNASAAKVSVPANSSVEITVSVTLNEETMQSYDKKYPNGMFLEGFVFFDNVDSDYETLNIPYMGFRGDWNAAPIFDLATAYDDISELNTSDAKYPLFYTTTLNSLVNGYDVVLGANQFTGTSLPDYFGGSSTSYYNTIRNYLNNLRASDELNGAYVTISPNGDGKDDIAYAALYLLRNAKAVCIVIKDKDGNIVKVTEPEYEYFEAKVNDGNQTQQAALSYGTKYNREMYWDGTDFDGNLVEEGTYTFEVRAMLEYDYLNSVDYGDKDSCLEVLLNSNNIQTQSFDVNVDITAPKVDMSLTRDNVLTVNANDASGIQAMAVYYKNNRVSDIIRVNDTETTMTFDLKDLVENLPDKSVADDLEVQVVDYGMNVASAVDPVVVNKTALSIAVDMAKAVTQEQLDKVVPAVANEFKAALQNAQNVFGNEKATQGEVDAAFDRLANVMQMLEFYKGDKAALQKMMDQIANLSANDYTDSTWKALQAVLPGVNEVIGNANAMQDEVDEVYTELVKAFV